MAQLSRAMDHGGARELLRADAARTARPEKIRKCFGALSTRAAAPRHPCRTGDAWATAGFVAIAGRLRVADVRARHMACSHAAQHDARRTAAERRQRGSRPAVLGRAARPAD